MMFIINFKQLDTNMRGYKNFSLYLNFVSFMQHPG